MKINKIVIISSDQGNFAFTKDNSSVNLLYQVIGKHNQFYFSTNENEAGNLNNDWDIIDMMGLDKDYIKIVEEALKQLN
tara:strand:+ start:270 stop:506 length:237 start_codon:yes stop_codon:yes gene_type:complete